MIFMMPEKRMFRLPKTRISVTWPCFKRLALKLAEARETGAVEIFTDRITLRELTRDYIKLNRKRFQVTRLMPSNHSNPLGFVWTSFWCGGDVELRVVTDRWFDTYRRARLRRGWKPIALAYDFSQPQRNKNHRLIYFK